MRKLCIVDDEITVLNGLINSLDWESYGIIVKGSFSDPLEALASMQDESYDILLTDICMKGLTGLELIEQAKMIHKDLDVVVISAWDNFSYVKKALKLGAVNYLLKPLDVEELEETVQMILEKKKEKLFYTSDHDSNMIAFRNSVLERWLKNKINEYELCERAEMLKIDLNRESYTCCLIKITGQENSFEHSSLVMEQAVTEMTDLFSGYFFLYKTDMIGGIIFDQDDDSARLELFFRSFIGRIEKGDIKLFCTIGSSMNNFMMLYRSYEDARLLQTLNVLKRPVLNYRDYKSVSEHFLLKEYLGHIKKAFLMGSYPEAKQYYYDYINEAERQREGLTLKAAHFLAANILVILKENLSTVYLPGSIIQTISTMVAESSLRSKLELFFDDCISLITSQSNDMHLYVKKTIQWIYQEMNQDISLKTAASQLNVNSAYLGQLFHSQTGKYFNNFLSEVRLEKAKYLIINSDLSIREISVKVGFSSSSYFNRIFKKRYAMPPNEYRQQKRAGLDSRS